MLFTDEELQQIARDAKLTQLEQAERKERRTFLDSFYGINMAGLKKDHAWFATQTTLNQMRGVFENIAQRSK